MSKSFSPAPEVRVLIDAKALLERPFGWTRKTYSRSRLFYRAYCLDGAIVRVAMDEFGPQQGLEISCAAEKLVVARFPAFYGGILVTGSHSKIWIWNDAEGRTKRQVLDLLEETIQASFGVPVL